MSGKPMGDVPLDTAINIRIPTDLKAAAEVLAKANRRTLAQWLRLLIEREVKAHH